MSSILIIQTFKANTCGSLLIQEHFIANNCGFFNSCRIETSIVRKLSDNRILEKNQEENKQMLPVSGGAQNKEPFLDDKSICNFQYFIHRFTCNASS